MEARQEIPHGYTNWQNILFSEKKKKSVKSTIAKVRPAHSQY